MRLPLRVTPTTQFTTVDGKLTREAGDLLRQIVDWIERPILPAFTETEIADKDSIVNKRGKDIGSLVLDSTNGLLMVALGAAPTDDWKVVEDGTTVTPA